MSLLGCRFHCRRVTPKAPSLCLGNRRHSGGGCSIGLGLGGEGEKRPVSPVRDTYCEQESRLCCFKPAADKGFCLFVCSVKDQIVNILEFVECIPITYSSSF